MKEAKRVTVRALEHMRIQMDQRHRVYVHKSEILKNNLEILTTSTPLSSYSITVSLFSAISLSLLPDNGVFSSNKRKQKFPFT